MKTYICTVCGYIYDEAAGIPEAGIAPDTKWAGLPDDWTCPLCGASKDEFEEQTVQASSPPKQNEIISEEDHELRELSAGEKSALFSNLSKGCEKQYRLEEAEYFNQLSEYFKNISKPSEQSQFSDIFKLLTQNLNTDYAQANSTAVNASDRGALRALVWGEKVTRILSSILTRYEKKKNDLLKDTNIYVCEICGFVYVGDVPPEICPVCKVPNMKIQQIGREAV